MMYKSTVWIEHKIEFNFEHLKERVYFDGCKYTPLYKKGIKETRNKPMETIIKVLLPSMLFAAYQNS